MGLGEKAREEVRGRGGRKEMSQWRKGRSWRGGGEREGRRGEERRGTLQRHSTTFWAAVMLHLGKRTLKMARLVQRGMGNINLYLFFVSSGGSV